MLKTSNLGSGLVSFVLVSLFSIACQGGDGEKGPICGPPEAHTQAACCDGSEDSAASQITEGGFTVVWISSNPVLPRVGLNSLRVQILDTDSQPVDDATFSRLGTYYAGFRNGTDPTVSPVGSNGEYEITDVNYSNVGQWSLEMEISANGQSSGRDLNFFVCVQ